MLVSKGRNLHRNFDEDAHCRSCWERGQESILNELWVVIAELEESRNPDSSYGRGQLSILRKVVRKMTEGYDER